MSDRDPVVAEALRRIIPPEHRAGFWDDLSRALDDDAVIVRPPLAKATADRTNRTRWLVAAVLLVAIAAAGVLATRPGGDDDGSTVIVDQPTTTSAPTTTTTTSASTSTSTTATAPAAPATPTPDVVVSEWLDAVGAGDLDAAADRTGPRSRANVPSLEGILREAGEGYGAWAASPERSFTEVEVDDDLTIVVVTGTWTGEGATEVRSDAFPVARGDDGRWLVEPWAYPLESGPLRILQPAPSTGLPPDATIEVEDRGDGRYLFSLDDGEIVGNGNDPVWDPPGDMTSQTHLLVAVHLDGEGVTAAATTFLVEG